MARHSIARATPRSDFTVAIEWTNGSSGVIDFRAEIAKGGVLSHLRGAAVFLHRLFIQSAGKSLAWQTPSVLIDFHVDDLWQRSHTKSVAAE
jgi:hypothetical protein